MFAVSSAQAALVVPAGNSLVVNDTDLNITWTQDANLFKTLATASGDAATFVTTIINSVGGKIFDTPNSLDTPANSGYRSLAASDFDTGTGTMSWWGAQAWVGYLNSISYGGVTGWRLPTSDTCVGGNCTSSELGHWFYSELGGTANQSITNPSFHNANYNLFSNVQSHRYWSDAEYALNPVGAWSFITSFGAQGPDPKSVQGYGWAVRDGQVEVAAVPVPAAAWLMGSALVGLLGLGRRKAGLVASPA